MTSYVVECKNKDALALNPNLPNGDFNTIIQDKIMLEEGDAIELKNAFIDTSATEAQKIVIPDDLTLQIQHLNYIINHFGKEHMTCTSQQYTNAPDPLDPPILTTDPAVNDCFPYWLCNKVDGNANLRELKGLNYGHADMSKNLPIGGFNVFCNFTDGQGVKRSVKRYLPVDTTKASKIIPDPIGNFNCVFDTTKPMNLSANAPTSAGTGGNGFLLAGTGVPANTFPTYKNTVVPAGIDVLADFPTGKNWSTSLGTIEHYMPAEFTTPEMHIPAGNYDPNDLCELINRELTKIGSSITESDLIDNTFLVTVPKTSLYQFCSGVSTYPREGDQIARYDMRYKYDKDNGKDEYNGVYVGASQMVLSFEPATQKFLWEFIHSPYISGNNPAVGYQTGVVNNRYNPGETRLAVVDRHGGIAFKEFTAVKKGTTEAVDFWSGQLGLQLDTTKPDCLLVNFTIELNGIRGDIRPQAYIPAFNPQPQIGVNITGGFQAISSAVQNTDLFPYVPKLGGAGQPTGVFFSTSNKTNGIEGGDNILSIADKMTFGYYLIEVKSNFQNNFVTTEENRRNVIAIVSRYYAKDAYTSAGSEASILYQHKGEPVLLSSFDIRILDSDKVLAENIGEDSTVFLNIIKADQPQNKK